MLAEAIIKESKLHDITHFGIRAAIAVIFIVNASGYFNPDFAEWLVSIGIPAEMQIPIALAQLVSGTFLLVGVLSRISASLLSIIMLGAIFHVKKASDLTGEGGYQIDLILLAACLAIIAIGPGRVSISHLVKRIPRFLQ
ncbi:MAG: DoxX family protein [Nitrosopumilales archaeon]|nr:MAG: DoxX family protein [Nitrosopumilales archaeon]